MAYIVKPLVTEKVTDLTEKHNVFCFVVRPEANKLQIQNEVEALYNVKVVSVNTVNYAGKNKSRYTKAGLLRGKTNAFKKAYVTLKEGESIDFFSNI
ncbi:MAG: 50S ribosomal protein L23 [Prevotella sp.]|jgi:ribosomal protein L23|uniref:50S ribosomal protein L23 n=1 Tax=Alloprevotella sp. TaxID=1872471 RepID=UPI002E996257|nr:50S ribosomal protein L23 [Prevotella sp.]MEE0446636.1 50S ribosomal protein L23 [Prevotellamassilia sp.]